jgi:hypothetical protein
LSAITASLAAIGEVSELVEAARAMW